ncbi:MAG: phosphatidylserine decarboxylase family protein [Acidobacteria bacterium]|nr:phosphatidylserine decarboxylase family protein [Acidobacteriota bacterium]
MRIDPAAWPFVGGALALGALAGWTVHSALGAAGLILAAVFLAFFRDPDRAVTQLAGAVLAPADGRVLVAGLPTVRGFPDAEWRQVSIFLSPTDVHVNRMPVAGRVLKVRYHPGRFLPAYRADAGDLNEYTEVWIDHDGQAIVVRQVVGILARRIVCRTAEGAVVHAGDRFGVMKFGSRMDVLVPATARIAVAVGDRVAGAVTVIAVLEQP